MLVGVVRTEVAIEVVVSLVVGMVLTGRRDTGAQDAVVARHCTAVDNIRVHNHRGSSQVHLALSIRQEERSAKMWPHIQQQMVTVDRGQQMAVQVEQCTMLTRRRAECLSGHCLLPTVAVPVAPVTSTRGGQSACTKCQA